MENITQLEEMRRQMAILNSKIEREEILNDKLMRRSMRSDMSFLKRKHVFMLVLCTLMIPYSLLLFGKLGLSVAFSAATVMFFLVVIGYTLYVDRYLNYDDLMNGNLLDVRCKVAHAMKFEHDWLRFGLPAGILWGMWYAYEYVSMVDEELRLYILGGICLSLAVGMGIGLRLRHKMLKAYREILFQIDAVQDK